MERISLHDLNCTAARQSGHGPRLGNSTPSVRHLAHPVVRPSCRSSIQHDRSLRIQGARRSGGPPLAAASGATLVSAPIRQQGYVTDARQLLSLLDVEAPYARLSTLRISGDKVWVRIEAESVNPCEIHTPMVHAELCRHMAVVGEVAIALANPVLRRHFYLATKSAVLLAASPGTLQRLPPASPAPSCSVVEFEGQALRFRRGVATAVAKAYLPASSSAPRQLYAEATGQYLVVPQDVFRAQFGAQRNACADIARDKINSLTMPSPYVDPIFLTDVQAPSEHVRTGKLHFNDLNMTLGHFPDVPALPASTVLANGMRLLAEGFSSPAGGPARFTVVQNNLRFHRLPALGERMLLTCTDTDGARRSFSCRAAGEGDGQDVVSFNVRIAMQGDPAEAYLSAGALSPASAPLVR